VTEVNTLAEQLIEDEHPEEATIRQRQSVSYTSCGKNTDKDSELFQYFVNIMTCFNESTLVVL
jgi:hypothetical protein